MPENIIENINKILSTLSTGEFEKESIFGITPQVIQGSTGMSPEDINDTVSIFEESGFVE